MEILWHRILNWFKPIFDKDVPRFMPWDLIKGCTLRFDNGDWMFGVYNSRTQMGFFIYRTTLNGNPFYIAVEEPYISLPNADYVWTRRAELDIYYENRGMKDGLSLHAKALEIYRKRK